MTCCLSGLEECQAHHVHDLCVFYTELYRYNFTVIFYYQEPLSQSLLLTFLLASLLVPSCLGIASPSAFPSCWHHKIRPKSVEGRDRGWQGVGENQSLGFSNQPGRGGSAVRLEARDLGAGRALGTPSDVESGVRSRVQLLGQVG